MRLTDDQLNRFEELAAIDLDSRTAEIGREAFLALITEVRERGAWTKRLLPTVLAVLSESTRLTDADARALTAEIARRLTE